ncbi:hypothetical protein JQ615_25330 [Bradyrhizobium jicamae]|uniref:PD-(D/E)XK nuclease superfamily protein n=1 Tax=Bradyrhizobium jicamae TaxID=280332 RepID=A0ABS5FPM7_9BRAD|nr:hypothetical protein [Bradyrhizobium jicamae]MBR0798716.1 hypothetical protein [Bradyrhizobium jicamae]
MSSFELSASERSKHTIAFMRSARERDLDHFLIEELQASSDFRDWFIRHLSDCFSPPQNAYVRTERSPPRLTDDRQTDLRLAYYSRDDDLVAAVLIESKVADGFQTNQAEDYLREVTAWREAVGTRQVASVLVGPSKNKLIGKGPHFDAFVSVDEMAAFLKMRKHRMRAGELRERLTIRISLLEALAGKTSEQWNPQPVAARVSLADVYDRLVQTQLSGFQVNRTSAGKSADDRFYGEFPGSNQFRGDVRLKHRIYEGIVCLEFRRPKLAKADVGKLNLPADGTVYPHWTGKANDTLQLQVRATAVPKLDDLGSQETAVVASLEAIRQLATWFLENVHSLNQISTLETLHCDDRGLTL